MDKWLRPEKKQNTFFKTSYPRLYHRSEPLSGIKVDKGTHGRRELSDLIAESAELPEEGLQRAGNGYQKEPWTAAAKEEWVTWALSGPTKQTRCSSWALQNGWKGLTGLQSRSISHEDSGGAEEDPQRARERTKTWCPGKGGSMDYRWMLEITWVGIYRATLNTLPRETAVKITANWLVWNATDVQRT